MKRYVRSASDLEWTTQDSLMKMYVDGYMDAVDYTKQSKDKEDLISYMSEHIFDDLTSVTYEEVEEAVRNYINREKVL